MSSAEITTRHNADRHRVEAVTEDGTVAGFSQYRRLEENYEFFHTEVDDAFEGQGVGGRIARAVVQLVRDEGVRIIPTCPFIAGWMAKHPESLDLLADGVTLDG